MSEVKQRLMLLYGSEGNGPKVQVLMQDDTMWMTQKQMSELFGVDRTVIGKHLKIIFDSEELAQDVVCANFAHMASDGREYVSKIYSILPSAASGRRFRIKKPLRNQGLFCYLEQTNGLQVYRTARLV